MLSKTFNSHLDAVMYYAKAMSNEKVEILKRLERYNELRFLWEQNLKRHLEQKRNVG
ncbi:hypothetical protein JW968_00215 [Candidatus Woesearchaeota archaeon]|nr:hypothetical protein [Candidatus Woesearchaeota archaeon]